MANFRVVLIDDDIAIRQSLKALLDSISKNLNSNLEIFSSSNGLEGIGFIFVINPEVIIIDSTLPKYSGREVVEYLATNPKFNDRLMFVLHDGNIPLGNLPPNYIVLNKKDKNFVENFASLVERSISNRIKNLTESQNINDISKTQSTLNFEKVKLNFRKFLSQKVLTWGNRSDTLMFKIKGRDIQSDQKRRVLTNPIPKIFNFILWLGAQFVTSLFASMLILVAGEVKDGNIKQSKSDAATFRVRNYPSLITVLVSIIFVVFEVVAFTTGGIIIFNTVKLTSIFADVGKEVSLNLNDAEYDHSKVEYVNGALQLKKIVTSTPVVSENPVSAPVDSSANPETTVSEGYSTDSPSITFNQKVEFDNLISVLEDSSINTIDSSIPGAESTSKIQKVQTLEELKNRTLPANVITYQLSPDGSSWYFYNVSGCTTEIPCSGSWLKTTENSSNTVQEVNQFLTDYVAQVGGNSLYVKTFLHSDGATEVSVKNILVERELTFVSGVNPIAGTETSNQTSSPLSFPVSFTNPVEVPLSYPVTDTNGNTVSIVLPAPQILNASFANGQKHLDGRVAGVDIPDDQMSKYSINIYFTNSTDTLNQAQDKEDLIGTTPLQKVNVQGNTEYLFQLDVASTPGGLVTAELVYTPSAGTGLESSGTPTILTSNLSKPVHNSTFTVTETGDQSDASAGNGTCDYDTGTAGSQCTLRAAIQEANALAGADIINFSIPVTSGNFVDYDNQTVGSNSGNTGAGAYTTDPGDDFWTIRPATVLPTISQDVTIDATTQTTSIGNMNTSGPEIEIKGDGTFSGIVITGTNAIINGIILNNYNDRGIDTSGTNTTVKNSYIGSGPKGATDLTTGTSGGIYASGSFSGLAIGTTTSDGNLIAGNVVGINLQCGTTSTKSYTIKGNKIGLNAAATGAIANTTGIILNGWCAADIGGSLSTERNYISGNGKGIDLQLSLATNPNVGIYNNFFGTDTAGTTIIANTVANITMGTGSFTTGNNINIGASGKGNLFRGSTVQVLANRKVLIAFNSFGDSSSDAIVVGATNIAQEITNIVQIQNNYIGSGTDPYFSITLASNINGIENIGGSPLIQGNAIIGSTNFGIANRYAYGAGYIRTSVADDFPSRPSIGGTGALTGSLDDNFCGALTEITANCIKTNAYDGIYSIDTIPTNETTLYTDNNFQGGNGPSNNRNIEQAWYGLMEIDSSTFRRTDLADGTYTLNFPSNTLARTGDNPSTAVTSGTNMAVTCTLSTDCPLTAGNSSGVSGSTEAIVPSGSTTSIFSNALNWYRVSEYLYDGSGVKTSYANWQFDSNHVTSKIFSFDGSSTTNVMNGYTAHTSNSISYADRGEPWALNLTANRTIATALFGRFQISEIDLVDANPVLDGSGHQVITVDSTNDTGNGTITYIDDGGGAGSGGIGKTTTEGLPDGKTSLREAILVADTHAGTDYIYFNIPTTDGNFLDYDNPTAASNSGATGVGAYGVDPGDDYWSIRPATTYATITGPTIIDGATQETNQGDKNTSGPDIEINGATPVGTITGLNFTTNSNGSSLNKVVVNQFRSNTSSQAIFVANLVNGFTLTNSYIGTDVKARTANGNFRGLNLGDASNIVIGTSTSDGNVISGNTGIGIVMSCAAVTTSSMSIKGNKIGVSPDTETFLDNIGGAISTAGDCTLNIGDDNVTSRNYISSSATTSSDVIVISNNAADSLINVNIKNNFFCTDSTGVNNYCNINYPHDLIRIARTNHAGGTNPVVISKNFFINAYDAIATSDYMSVHDNRFGNISYGGAYYGYNTCLQDCTGYTFDFYNNEVGVFPASSDFPATTATGMGGVTVSERDINIYNNTFNGLGATTINVIGKVGGYIKGNLIENTQWDGMTIQADTSLRTLPTNYPTITIGGTNSFAGSKCLGLEKNCVYNSLNSGINIWDSPADKTMLLANNVLSGNGSFYSNLVPSAAIAQNYYFNVELFSGTARRTDLGASGTHILNYPAGTHLQGYRLLSIGLFAYTNITNNPIINVVCLNTYTDCPASGDTTGLEGYTATLQSKDLNIGQGNFEYGSSIMSNIITEDGTDVDLGGEHFTFDDNHIVSKPFSVDANSTSDPVNTGISRVSNGQTYNDRGEPWTDKPTATGNISTQDFGNYQFSEADIVDANPVKQNDNSYKITIDSPTNEDNVSISQYDKGFGEASGGGYNGVDGLSNLSTSLKESSIISGLFQQPTKIVFDSTMPYYGPSTSPTLESGTNSVRDTLDGTGIQYSGFDLPSSMPCLELNNQNNLTVQNFAFEDCQSENINVASGTGNTFTNIQTTQKTNKISNSDFSGNTIGWNTGDDILSNEISAIGSGPRQIFIDGNYLYITLFSTGGVDIFDISNPTTPVLVKQLVDGVGGFNNLAGAHDVVVQGNYMFVTARTDNTLSIIDITDKSNPVLIKELTNNVGGWTNLSNPIDMDIVGNTLYIAAKSSNAVSIIDITNKSNPVLIKQIVNNVGGFTNLLGADHVKIYGNYLYLSAITSSTFNIIDITNPASPAPVSQIIDGAGGFNNLGGIWGFEKVGNILYTADNTDNAISVIDVSNQAAPTLVEDFVNGVNGISTLTGPNYISINGNYMYASAQGSGAVNIFDISTPNNPKLVKSLVNNTYKFTKLGGIYDINFSGRYAYITGTTASAMTVVDLNGLGNISTSADHYSGSTSVNLITLQQADPMYQNIDVGNTGQYDFVGYVKDADTGSAVDSNTASLYYDGNPITTTYTDMGSGWFKLSAVITGVNAVKSYGVILQPFKNVYADDFTLQEQGTTPSVFSSSKTPIVLTASNEDSYGVVPNDAGDADSGPNDLMNYPLITSATNINSTQYTVSGTLDGNPTEAPFTIEVCESDGNVSSHGGCVTSLGTTTTSGTTWSLTVTGSAPAIFSGLATNNNGSTSEFGPNFYPMTLTYPLNETISNPRPLLDWTGILDPEIKNYQVYLDGNLLATVDQSSTEYQYPSSSNGLTGDHTWYVVAIRNNNEVASISQTSAFTVNENITPGGSGTTVNLDYPINSIVIDNPTPTLDWEHFNNADLAYYEVFINNVSVGTVDVSKGNAYTIPDDKRLANGDYTWYVKAYKNSFGLLGVNIPVEIAQSSVGKFSVKLEYSFMAYLKDIESNNVNLTKLTIGWKLGGSRAFNAHYKLTLTDAKQNELITKDNISFDTNEYTFSESDLNSFNAGASYYAILELVDDQGTILTSINFKFSGNKPIVPAATGDSVGDLIVHFIAGDNPQTQATLIIIAIPILGILLAVITIAATAISQGVAAFTPSLGFNFIAVLFSPFIKKKKQNFGGTLYDEVNGNPIPFGVIRITDTQNPQKSNSYVTDFDGKFDIGDSLKGGKYRLEASSSGYDKKGQEFDISTEGKGFSEISLFRTKEISGPVRNFIHYSKENLYKYIGFVILGLSIVGLILTATGIIKDVTAGFAILGAFYIVTTLVGGHLSLLRIKPKS